jgi:hypothetical protein
VSDITDDMRAFDPHDESSVFCAEDIDFSEVAVLECVDELEGA